MKINLDDASLFISSDWHLHSGGGQDKKIVEYITDKFLEERSKYKNLVFTNLGDMFDREESFNPKTIYLINKMMNVISDKYPNTQFWFLKGNHDALSEDRWESLLDYLGPNKNVVLGRTFFIKNNYLHATPKSVESLYGAPEISTVFIHEDILGAYFNSGNLKSSRGLNSEKLSQEFSGVLSGHYHYPRIAIRDGYVKVGGVSYLGAVRQLHIQDAGSQYYYYIYSDGKLKCIPIHSGCREFIRVENFDDEIPEEKVKNKVVYITELCDSKRKEEIIDKFKNLGALDVSFKFVKVSGGSKLVEQDVSGGDLPEYITKNVVDSNLDYIEKSGLSKKNLIKMGEGYITGNKSDLGIGKYVEEMLLKYKEEEIE